MGGKYECPAAFVAKWRETHPGYVSPYAKKVNGSSAASSTPRGLQESEYDERALQAANAGAQGSVMPSAIIVAKPGGAVSFETSRKHFPVYLKDSSYNTNPDFDDGVFDTLKTKITSSGLNITSFAFTFVTEGVYVFGDAADPANSQTIVVVDRRRTPAILPLTAKEMIRLGVVPLPPEMQVLPVGLAAIGPVFIAACLAGLLV